MLNTAKQAADIELVRTFFNHELHDIAYVSDETEGVLFIDVTNPAAPTWNGGKTETYFATNIFATEPADLQEPYTLFIPDGWHGLVWANAQPDEAPGTVTYSGDHPTLGEAYGIAVRDGWGYVADNHMGLVVMDLHVLNETAINITAWTDTPGSARDIVLAGDYAFIADGLAGPLGPARQRRRGAHLRPQLRPLRLQRGPRLPRRAARDRRQRRRRALLRHDRPASSPSTSARSPPPTPSASASATTAPAWSPTRKTACWCSTGRGPFRDETAPAAVTSLTVHGAERLQRHPGLGRHRRRPRLGPGHGVEIRYATDADHRRGQPGPRPPRSPIRRRPPAAGAAMTCDVSGLDELTTYHFAVRLRDDAGHLSGLSNDASATTLAGISLRNPRRDARRSPPSARPSPTRSPATSATP